MNSIRYAQQQMFRQENGDRGNVPNILAILTDGISTNPEETWTAARDARRQGIHIIAIGVGNQLNDEELSVGVIHHPN